MINSNAALKIKPLSTVKSGSKAAHSVLGLDSRDLKNLSTPTDLFPVRAVTVRGRTID